MSAVPIPAAPLLKSAGFWKRAFAHRSFLVGAVLTFLLALAALQREADAAHRVGRAALRLQADVEVFDVEQGHGQ